nr:MAG TPA: hypothetical protein [Caudoviricetes sp.]
MAVLALPLALTHHAVSLVWNGKFKSLVMKTTSRIYLKGLRTV